MGVGGGVVAVVVLFFILLLVVAFRFCLFVWFLTTGFLCIALAILELTLYIRLALNSEIRLSLPASPGMRSPDGFGVFTSSQPTLSPS